VGDGLGCGAALAGSGTTGTAISNEKAETGLALPARSTATARMTCDAVTRIGLVKAGESAVGVAVPAVQWILAVASSSESVTDWGPRYVRGPGVAVGAGGTTVSLTSVRSPPEMFMPPMV
jgi:hypothetical protein